MANIQIKDVPDDVHRTLKHRAIEAHQSLNEYLRQRLIEQARTPTVDDILAGARKSATADYTVEDLLEHLDEGRHQ
ncbi:FitA-like ribbon-helix-helix domain-containing protein [Actinacidiphila sp. bgisy167]|uniref:FitA-like ribbon-helix-helix domain-containing protein n=1 Tax=Actinacidiphila sp. bgisy167 TaxID=3413797 RepID=UPI003D746DEA